MNDGCYKGKVALFAFNGDPMCFAHVLINALDLREKNYDVRLIIEGVCDEARDGAGRP